jgi:hypothetical protein
MAVTDPCEEEQNPSSPLFCRLDATTYKDKRLLLTISVSRFFPSVAVTFNGSQFVSSCFALSSPRRFFRLFRG